MRVVMIAAGLAVVLAACGGEKKAADAAPAADQATAATATAAPVEATPTGAGVDVDMVLEGTAYKYVPADITVKAGDAVRFHNKSGGPHNVAFDPKEIPAGSEAAVDAALGANKMGPLTGALLVEQDAVFTLNTAGMPAGKYAINCTPHMALGMKGSITVQ